MKRISILAVLTVALAVAAGTASAGPASTTGQKNIVQTAVAAGQFKTLASLLTKAGQIGRASCRERV